MPEIKTCDQYVLRELDKTQKENETLQELVSKYADEIEAKDKAIAALRAELKTLNTIFGEKAEMKDGYISLWISSWGDSKDAYDLLKSIITEVRKKMEEEKNDN